jgi:two-component system chemotaxis response regulator CheB
VPGRPRAHLEDVADPPESQVDEAIRIALRIMEERAELVSRMARDAEELGRSITADLYARRAEEYRVHAEILRQAVLRSMERADLAVEDRAVVLRAVGSG